jgi:putative endonuclease
MTDNICRRVLEHKLKINEGFTKKYNVDKLVYFEIFDVLQDAIERENQIKAGSRIKKLRLVNSRNAYWHDLFPEICS